MTDPGLRRCARCGAWKPPSVFHNSRTGQFSYCADCRRQYDRDYYASRGRVARRERQRARALEARTWLDARKDGVPCADCGGRFPSYVMQWDHLPGYVKLGNVSRLLRSRPRSLVIEELAKCELVCANCHSLRTAARATKHAGSVLASAIPPDRLAESPAVYRFLEIDLFDPVGVVGLEPTKTSASQTPRSTN